MKEVLLGIVIILVGAGFVATAQADPVVANSTLLTLVVGFIPIALGIGVLLRAFDVI